MNEFEAIANYFSFSSARLAKSIIGVGDDCAVLSLDPGDELVVTTDTLVSGSHYLAGGDPALIARHALRVNLSDIAAMGARPLGFQLAITLQALDREWLAGFSRGLAEDAEAFGVPLIGGDTTRGPDAVTITMLGQVPAGEALLRSGAGEGDHIYVTGTLGDARGGLAALQRGEAAAFLAERYWLPQPRLAAGARLRGLASAALDVSDGLLQDVGHIARASGLCAEVVADLLPLSESLRGFAGEEIATGWALSGGDDYELCFTVAESRSGEVEKTLAGTGTRVTRIGRTLPPCDVPVKCIDSGGRPFAVSSRGYDHFQCD